MNLARFHRVAGPFTKNGLRRVTVAGALFAAVLLASPLDVGPSRPVRFSNGFTLEQDRVVPVPPPDLVLDSGSARGANCRVVQFAVPIERRRLDRLAALGVELLGYLPPYAVVARLEPSVRSALDSLDFVAGSAPFEPVFKLAPELLDFAGSRALVIVAFPGHDLDSLAAVIHAPDITVVRPSGRLLHCIADRRETARLARLDAVQWLQPDDRPVHFNHNAQWVVQTGWQSVAPPDTAGRRIWQEGIRGQGIVISLADAGISVDHEMFADLQIPIRGPGVYLHHRKVVAYKLFRGVFGDAGAFHGTGGCGTAAGNDEPNGNSSSFDGMAPAARISFLDVGDGAGNIVINPDEIAELLDSTWAGSGTGLTIPQTSISWGWSNNGSQYRIQESQADAACWRYPELLTVCAAGNDPRWIAHPAAAKNVLTVGACGNGIGADTTALFSGQGPTADRRFKPDLLAPGIELWTAGGPGVRDYRSVSGTSFSAPAVNGACALIRQYLNDGWYPTGRPEPANRIPHPSSALMRAMATVSTDANLQGHEVPDPAIGWGRLDLDSVLYFAGDTRRLILFDETAGLATGEYHEYAVRVAADSVPLRACLAWTDTAAMPNAERTLVNDLDLWVFSPSGQYYNGNRYFLGQSSHNPLDFDSLNNLECFRRNRPETTQGGVWQFKVVARSVFTERQPYALVVTGACELLPGIAEIPSKPGRATVEIIGNPAAGSARLRCLVPASERVAAAVFDQTGRLIRRLCDSRLPPGTHDLVWNLCDRQGIRVRPGIYFLRVTVGDHSFTPKLVVTR